MPVIDNVAYARRFPRIAVNANFSDIVPAKVGFDRLRMAVRLRDRVNVDVDPTTDSPDDVPSSVQLQGTIPLAPVNQTRDFPATSEFQIGPTSAGADATGQGGGAEGIIDYSAVTSARWGYSRYGATQPFQFTTSEKLFAASIRLKRNMGVVEWLRKNQGVGVELFVATRTDEVGGSGGAAPNSDSFFLVTSGSIDSTSVSLRGDEITFSCRDDSAALWEQRLVSQVIPAPTVFSLLQTITSVFGVGVSILLAQSEVGNGGVLDIKLGMKDARLPKDGKDIYFMPAPGIRYWDLLQRAADMANATTFFEKGVLFFATEGGLVNHTGRMVLEYGKNLIDVPFQQSSLQSSGIVVVVAITDTKRGSAEISAEIQSLSGNTGTYYIVVSGFKGSTVQLTTKMPKASAFGKRKIQRWELQDFDIKQASRTAQKLYLDLVNKEVVFEVKMAGHAFADLLTRYVLTGLPERYKELNNMDLLPQSISHDISQQGGWVTSITLSNTLDGVFGGGDEGIVADTLIEAPTDADVSAGAGSDTGILEP